MTRYILMGQAITWILSFFIDFSYAIANTVHFTIFKFELYRIVLSPFVCPSLMSLVFAYISFVDNGRRLEFSVGSTAFAALLLTIAVVTNLAHLVVCFTLYALSGNRGFFFSPGKLITVYFSFCAQFRFLSDPPKMQRLVFGLFCLVSLRSSVPRHRQIPIGDFSFLTFQRFTIHWRCFVSFLFLEAFKYPIFSQWRLDMPTGKYFMTMSLFSRKQVPAEDSLTDLRLYLFHRNGFLDRLKIGGSRSKQWEDSILVNFAGREGWVISNDAAGSGAWTETGEISAGGGFNLFSQVAGQQQPQQQTAQGAGNVATPGDPRPGRAFNTPSAVATGDSTGTTFPPSGGRALGSATRRTNADPRQARLQAIESRSGATGSDDQV